MLKLYPDTRLRLSAGAALLAALLAGCSRPSSPTPPVPAPTVAPAPVDSAPAAMPAPAAAASAESPQSGKGPPVISAASPQPRATEPAIASMTLASASSKMGVPVDLHYSFDGAVTIGQPVTLHLAAVPRVAGTNLKVSIKDEPGIQKNAVELGVQKASASTAYRQQLAVTRLAGGPSELHVLVTMDGEIGTVFSWFKVPFIALPAAGKQNPVVGQ